MIYSGRVRPTYFRGVIMFIPSWLRSLARTLGFNPSSSRPARRQAARNRRPARSIFLLEQLEDRVVPAVLDLTGTSTAGIITSAIFEQQISPNSAGTGNFSP